MKRSTCIHFCINNKDNSVFYHTIEGVEINLKVNDTLIYSEEYHNLLSKTKKLDFSKFGFLFNSEYIVCSIYEHEENEVLGIVVNYYVMAK